MKIFTELELGGPRWEQIYPFKRGSVNIVLSLAVTCLPKIHKGSKRMSECM